MPNWCANSIHITHDDPGMITRLVEAYNSGKGVCSEFFPEPEDIGDGWHSWRTANWGVKWDFSTEGGAEPIDHVPGTREIAFVFDTAWSPPIGLYGKLQELGFHVKAYYWEPGCAFCGRWEDGDDHYVDIRGDSNWVAENVDPDIDEEMGISVAMDEWEQDEEEEQQG